MQEQNAHHTVRERVFKVGLDNLALLARVLKKFQDGGQFESRIFEKLFASNVWTALFDGITKTLEAAALAILCAVVVGFLLAVARPSVRRSVNLPATAVIEFFRAVPLQLLMVFIFYFIQQQTELETDTSAVTSVVVALTLYNGAVLAEVFRAGIHAVPRGQSPSTPGPCRC